MSELEHQTVREQIADGELDAAARQHLAGCVDCQAWQQRLATILRAAAEPDDVDTPEDDRRVDELLTAVVRASRSVRWQRRLVGVGAAAAVVVVIAGVLVVSRSSGPSERGSVLAGSWTSESTRFVFDATTNVPLPTVSVADDLEPMSLQRFPQCEGVVPPTDTVPTSVDISALTDSLFTDRPCETLAALDEQIGDQSSAALLALQQRLLTVEGQLQALQSDLSSTDPITSQSANAAVVQLKQLKLQLTDQLSALLDAHDRSIKGLAPLADAASAGRPTAGFEPVARNAMTALVAEINQADASTLPESVQWHTLATGTWASDSVSLSGSTENPDGGVVTFDAAEGDPLAIASALFAVPDTIPAILHTAPAADGNIVNWKVPTDLVAISGVASLEATATLDGDRLDTLVLTGERTDGTTISITITVGR